MGRSPPTGVDEPGERIARMRYFRIREDSSSGYTGDLDGKHKWKLPGIFRCPACKATWSAGAGPYPSVDLTPIASQADFETARAEPIEEYERLRELVRPLLPPGVKLEPGVSFGPLIGQAQGRFGAFVSPVPWWLMARRETLERLQSEELKGLRGYPMQLRFRQRNPPELLELEILPAGRLHLDCLPPDRKPSSLWPARPLPPQGAPARHHHVARAPRPLPAGGLLHRHHLLRALRRRLPAPGPGWRHLPPLAHEGVLKCPPGDKHFVQDTSYRFCARVGG
jgi:uncharacterized double-CXXCG motif protein